jgi:hypothetical protein
MMVEFFSVDPMRVHKASSQKSKRAAYPKMVLKITNAGHDSQCKPKVTDGNTGRWPRLNSANSGISSPAAMRLGLSFEAIKALRFSFGRGKYPVVTQALANVTTQSQSPNYATRHIYIVYGREVVDEEKNSDSKSRSNQNAQKRPYKRQLDPRIGFCTSWTQDHHQAQTD